MLPPLQGRLLPLQGCEDASWATKDDTSIRWRGTDRHRLSVWPSHGLVHSRAYSTPGKGSHCCDWSPFIFVFLLINFFTDLDILQIFLVRNNHIQKRQATGTWWVKHSLSLLKSNCYIISSLISVFFFCCSFFFFFLLYLIYLYIFTSVSEHHPPERPSSAAIITLP